MLRTDATNLNYTPVTKETFAVWCEQYKERIRLEREANRTGLEDKPTGKELFLMNRAEFDDLTLEPSESEESKGEPVDLVDEGAAAANDNEEEKVDEDDEDEEAFVYDRALYDPDALNDDDEDIDFDDE